MILRREGYFYKSGTHSTSTNHTNIGRQNMKRFIAVVIAVIAMFVVASPAQASMPTWTKKDKAFVYVVRHEDHAFKYVPAKELISIAHQICAVLDEGTDESEVLMMAEDNGLTEHQGVTIVVASMAVYCPWHGDDIR